MTYMPHRRLLAAGGSAVLGDLLVVASLSAGTKTPVSREAGCHHLVRPCLCCPLQRQTSTSFPASTGRRCKPTEPPSTCCVAAEDNQFCSCTAIPRSTLLSIRLRARWPRITRWSWLTRAAAATPPSPKAGDNHIAPSFQAMAFGQVETMCHLGSGQSSWMGHNRGGQIRRLRLDHSKKVCKATVLDIAPRCLQRRLSGGGLVVGHRGLRRLAVQKARPERAGCRRVNGRPKLICKSIFRATSKSKLG